MLSTKLQDAQNEQINAEMWSAYLYLSMAMHFEAEGRPGIANWFNVQFQEELAHAEIFRNYVNARGCRVVLKAIAAVPTAWGSELASAGTVPGRAACGAFFCISERPEPRGRRLSCRRSG